MIGGEDISGDLIGGEDVSGDLIGGEDVSGDLIGGEDVNGDLIGGTFADNKTLNSVIGINGSATYICPVLDMNISNICLIQNRLEVMDLQVGNISQLTMFHQIFGENVNNGQIIDMHGEINEKHHVKEIEQSVGTFNYS